MQAYQRQMDSGGRELVSTDDLLAAANSKLASMQWRQLKSEADVALSASTGKRAKVESFELLDDVFELMRQELGQLGCVWQLDPGVDRPGREVRDPGPGAC